MTDTELKLKGFELLRGSLGMVELEKFDYTKWRQNLFSNLSGEEISKMAMKNRLKNT